MRILKLSAVIAAETMLILAGIAVLALLLAPGWRNTLDRRGDAYWKLFFLHESSGLFPELQAFWQHDAHPTLGWVPKKNFRGGGPNNDQETTNDRGHRASKNYAPQPGKYTVAVVGDSFTYGMWAPDRDVWPAILQRLDDRLHVINLAVGGYGVDQMYLMLRDNIEEYKPQLVVFALISDDLNRSLLSFRECRKPRFVVGKSGELILTNTPIGDINDTRKRLRAQYGYLFARFRLERENRRFLKTLSNGEFDREWKALNEKIFENAFRCASEHGIEFLLVYLGSGPEITHRPSTDYYPTPSELFCSEVAEKFRIHYLSTRKAFLDAGGNWTEGHYGAPEARFVAGLVYDRIRSIADWTD